MGKKITVTGRVHNVGYRLFLLEQADYLFIPYFDARNVTINGEEALVILVDGDEEVVEEFVDFVRNNRPKSAVVKNIEVEDYTGRIRDIEAFRNTFNTSQLSKIAQTGVSMVEKQGKTIEVLGSVKEDTTRMLEKQDKTIEVLDSVKENTTSMLEKQDETVSEIRDLRKDMREYMEERLSE